MEFFIKMENTNYSRKLDTMGRIMLPKPLREQFGLESGEEYTFFKYEAEDGRIFLCIECPEIPLSKLKEARKLVKIYGMK